MTTHPTDAAAQQADGTPLRVARSEDVPERGRLILDVGGRSFALFRVGGRLYAYDNVCPHQGGPVCQGLITPRVTEPVEVDGTTRGLAFDESALHLVCPWHGFEFDLTTGRHPGRPQIGLRSLRVEERKGTSMSISEETALREPSARLAADTPLDRLVEPLQRIAERLRDEPARGVPPGADEPLLRTLVAATATVYAAASEATGGEIPLGEGVSTTDALVLACALLRAHHLNPFDLALWFTRGEAR